MVEFAIGYTTSFIVTKVYLKKNNINLGINNNIVAIGLSFIIIIFLSIIQFIFDLILNIFI